MPIGQLVIHEKPYANTGDPVSRNIKLDKAVHDMLTEMAEKYGVSVSFLIDQALIKYLYTGT